MNENKSDSIQRSFPELQNHPQWSAASFILQTLQKKGFEALLAGGAVRDLLIHRQPGDLDIATSALPDQVEKLFPQTVAVGKAFGVIRVIQEGHSIEVATYRHDLEYRDGRRPEGVVFTNRVEDAKRRDFTINALFYDPFKGIVYDDVRGQEDLSRKLLRCVGESSLRFKEDELRRLRLVRFVSQLGFQIESETRKALEKGLEGLAQVSRERVTEEIGKMWGGNFLREAFPIWLESGMAKQVDAAWEQPPFQWGPALEKIARQNSAEKWTHYFSFFFKEENLRTHFKLYRLPKEIEKFVESVWKNYQAIPDFHKLSRGEQKYQMAQVGFSLGLEYWIAHHASDEKLLNLLKEAQSQSPLPPPLVRAEHIQGQFQGAELGRVLKALYRQQLEEDWANLSQALDWLKENHSVAQNKSS